MLLWHEHKQKPLLLKKKKKCETILFKGNIISDLLISVYWQRALKVSFFSSGKTNSKDKSQTFRTFSGQYNTQSRINNIHKIRGKNSLDVIGHTHTSRPCLSAIRHSGGVCGPSCGASQSVNSPFFSLHRNVLQHGKSSPSQGSNTPTGLSGPFIQLQKKGWQLKKPESWFVHWSCCTVQHHQLPGRQRRRKSLQETDRQLFISLIGWSQARLTCLKHAVCIKEVSTRGKHFWPDGLS